MGGPHLTASDDSRFAHVDDFRFTQSSAEHLCKDIGHRPFGF